jgi:hypothetical protein
VSQNVCFVPQYYHYLGSGYANFLGPATIPTESKTENGTKEGCFKNHPGDSSTSKILEVLL